MRKFVSLIFFYFSYTMHVAAQDSIQATIVLIGDAGQLTDGRQPVINAVQKNIPFDNKTTVIYLGDNLYKTGLPDNSLPTYEIAKAPLDSQIHIAGKKPAQIYFVPGNHDWANGGRNGYESILRVQYYIDKISNEFVHMYPRDGCPGPVDKAITKDITLVMMDSQWWLHDKDKPGIESDCPTKTKAEVLVMLGDILDNNASKLVILALHHPFRSYGQHGGYFKLKQHIFPLTDLRPYLYIPLPLVGSGYPITRGVFGTAQDLKHPLYQQMIRDIEEKVKGHPNVIFVSGHEHNLQLIKDNEYNYIISGSGSKTSRVSKNKKAPFTSPKNGFVTLQVSKKKNVEATYYTVDKDSVTKAYTAHLLNFSKIKLEDEDTVRQVEYAFKDSVVIAASDKYKNYSGFKRVFLGTNYRKEWSTPIAMKIFNITKEKGGFKIKGLGGGKQTKSLQLEDTSGHRWVLRLVDKDPEKAVPENLRGTLAQKIVQDMISASHPYAPLVVPRLAKAVDIYTPEPEFFYIPDDPAFGFYRKLFAKRVGMLEDRDPARKIETHSTVKVMNKLLEDNDHHIDQVKVLNARLLDMMIGDFDRHADQWRWGTADTGKGKLYFPIPKDRDQAFFNSDGLLLSYLSRYQMRFLQGFKYNIRDIRGMNTVGKDFDRAFLNSLDEATWKSTADSFKKRMTDQVIKEAVEQYPPEIQETDTAFTSKKLKSRRDILPEEAMKYYRFLSKDVTVTGSNETEYFHVENDKGNLKLSVYKKDKKTDSATVMYRRTFDRKYTKELRLYGFQGDDKFEIDDDVSSRIKIRFIGGKGNDTFKLRGKVKNFVYDLSTEKNVLLNANRTNKEFSSDISVLEYKSTGYQYNSFVFPQVNLGYNVEDKFLLGIGFNSRTYGFRKEPYATNQKFSSLYAVNEGAYQLKYEGIFNRVLLKNDIVVNAELVNPTLNNFFGFGNSTVLDKNLPREYYRVRYKYVLGDLLLRIRANDIFHLSVGPSYYQYWSKFEDNKSRILSNPAIIGTDSTNIYSPKEYFGGKFKMDIRYLNNETLPTRGITWFTEISSLSGLNKNSNNISKLTSDITIYGSVREPSVFTIVFRGGWGKILSKNYEYFQALSLGGQNYIRGFRKNRFSGQSMVYTSLELRQKLFKSRSLLLPGDVGVLGFAEMGRVWLENEGSKKWHSTYGGGIFFIPYNLVMVSAAIGISPEDKLFNFTVGTKFNLTF